MLELLSRNKQLKPIHDRDSYSLSAEQVIAYELYKVIFKPMFLMLNPGKNDDTRVAAKITELVRALREGRIAYQGEHFYGKLTAEISRELIGLGARFDKVRRGYSLRRESLPLEVKGAIGEGSLLIKEQADALLKHLDTLKEAPVLNLEGSLSRTFEDLEKQFTASTIDLSVPPNLTEGVAERLAEEYSTNLQLAIQNWQDEAVLRLRRQVEANAMSGFRADRMEEILSSEYGVTQNKARFLARQETSLLVSKFREARYTEAGVNRYKWSTSHDERVRASHAQLAGRTFYWDSPPIVDQATGRRGNPGEDFNCRCIAIPIVRLP